MSPGAKSIAASIVLVLIAGVAAALPYAAAHGNPPRADWLVALLCLPSLVLATLALFGSRRIKLGVLELLSLGFVAGGGH